MSKLSTIGYEKKAAKLLELIQKVGIKYVNWDTWRLHKSYDNNFLYNIKYKICAPKEHKHEFHHFITWLDENPDFVEKARNQNSLDEIKDDPF